MKLKSELSSTLELSSKTLRLSDTISALSWEVAIRLGDDDERVQHGLDPTAFRFLAVERESILQRGDLCIANVEVRLRLLEPFVGGTQQLLEPQRLRLLLPPLLLSSPCL